MALIFLGLFLQSTYGNTTDESQNRKIVKQELRHTFIAYHHLLDGLFFLSSKMTPYLKTKETL
jgi:hypothetical protein